MLVEVDVQFFKTLTLCFGYEEENKCGHCGYENDEDNKQAPLNLTKQDRRENRYEHVHQPVRSHSQAHGTRTMLLREDFRGDDPADGSPAVREVRHEEVNHHDHHDAHGRVVDNDARRVRWRGRGVEREQNGQNNKRRGHSGTADEQHCLASDSVYEEESGYGGCKVDNTGDALSEQVRHPGRDGGENGWCVVHDDVNTGQLLETLDEHPDDEPPSHVALEKIRPAEVIGKALGFYAVNDFF